LFPYSVNLNRSPLALPQNSDRNTQSAGSAAGFRGVYTASAGNCGSGGFNMRSGSSNRLCTTGVVIQILLLGAMFCSLTFGEPESKMTLDQAKARLEKARTPVERARAHIQISEIVLREVKENVSLTDRQALEDWMTQYRDAISSARDTMVSSGRDPQRDPEGYKDLEILLRQHINLLSSWKRKVGSSKPIDDSLVTATTIQKEMLDLLFPVIGGGLTRQ
jgi:hypothetical protein